MTIKAALKHGQALRVAAVAILFAVSLGGSSGVDGVVTNGIAQFRGGAEQCGPKISVETPDCTVVEKRDDYELRKYPEGQIWVRALVANSTYLSATLIGFYKCFNFISGQNEEKEEIEMTGPVLIEPVPEASGYSISFFTPSRFSSVAEVPTPTDPDVDIIKTKETIKAVLGPFGGFPNESVYNKKWNELRQKLDEDGVGYDDGTVVYAGYSSPFEIFNRQQEVFVSLI